MGTINIKEAIITTKHVIHSKSKVTYIAHTEEGWQFLGKESVDERDVLVISLGSILQLYPDLSEILKSIDIGKHAFRDSSDNTWKVELIEVKK